MQLSAETECQGRDHGVDPWLALKAGQTLTPESVYAQVYITSTSAHTPRHPRPRRQLYSDLLQVEHEVFDGWESQRRVRSFLRPLCPAQVQTGHAAYVPLTASVKTVRLCTFWGCCFQLEELLPDLYCLFACFLACLLLLFSVRDLCISLYPLKSFTCNCMFPSLAPTFIST